MQGYLVRRDFKGFDFLAVTENLKPVPIITGYFVDANYFIHQRRRYDDFIEYRNAATDQTCITALRTDG